jgi:hypothetical protein
LQVTVALAPEPEMVHTGSPPCLKWGLAATAEGTRSSKPSTAPAPTIPIRRRGIPYEGARCLPLPRCLPRYPRMLSRMGSSPCASITFVPPTEETFTLLRGRGSTWCMNDEEGLERRRRRAWGRSASGPLGVDVGETSFSYQGARAVRTADREPLSNVTRSSGTRKRAAQSRSSR